MTANPLPAPSAANPLGTKPPAPSPKAGPAALRRPGRADNKTSTRPPVRPVPIGPQRRSQKTNANSTTWDRLRFTGRSAAASPERASTTSKSAAQSSADLFAQTSRTARSIVTAAAEVLAGIRPVDQLSRFTSPQLYAAIARRAGLAQRILGSENTLKRPLRARHTCVQLTPSGACEALVLLEVGERVRAAGARLETRRGRWIMTNLEIG